MDVALHSCSSMKKPLSIVLSIAEIGLPIDRSLVETAGHHVHAYNDVKQNQNHSYRNSLNSLKFGYSNHPFIVIILTRTDVTIGFHDNLAFYSNLPNL